MGRDILAEIAARADWVPTIPAEPDAAGLTLLKELVDAWTAYAKRMVEGLPGLPPGELLFQGAPALDEHGNEIVDPAHPPLFPGTLGTTGFGARNYGARFQKATGQPLGAMISRSMFTGIDPSTL